MTEKKGVRVRAAIERMLSTDEVAIDGNREERPCTPAQTRAARAHVADIERSVGRLVGDEQLEKDADEHERGAGSRGQS